MHLTVKKSNDFIMTDLLIVPTSQRPWLCSNLVEYDWRDLEEWIELLPLS